MAEMAATFLKARQNRTRRFFAMAYEQRNNTGSIWVNDRKDKDEHPDRTGSIMVAGVEYWLNGWIKRTKGGKPFLSLAVKPKVAAPESKPELDDEIPF